MMINLSNTLKKKNNKKGFTLIELIVVIAILGILAAIAIPRLTGVRSGAEQKADAASLKTVESAMSVAIANGDIKFTVTNADTGNGTWDTADAWTVLEGNYLDERPESSENPGKKATITLNTDGTYETGWEE